MLKFARQQHGGVQQHHHHQRSSSVDRGAIGAGARGRYPSPSRIPVRLLQQQQQQQQQQHRSQPVHTRSASVERHLEGSLPRGASAILNSSSNGGCRRQLAFDRDVTPRELRQLHQVYHMRQVQQQQQQQQQLLDPLTATPMPSPPRPPVVQRATLRPTSKLPMPSPSSSVSSCSGDSHSDYMQLSSGTLCRIRPQQHHHQQQPPRRGSLATLGPLTPTLEKLSSHISHPGQQQQQQQQQHLPTAGGVPPPPAPPPKSALKKGPSSSSSSSYTFHRDIERLVATKLDLLVSLDTSSESGYGSDDHDSLNSRNSSRESPAAAAAISPLAAGAVGTCSPPPVPKRPRSRRRVRFDSYVLLLQALRDRDAAAVSAHVGEVRCPEALRTDEVVAEFVGCVAEGRADVAGELLRRGCSANAVDPSHGITPLHIAAAFNSLPLVKLLIRHGAAVFSRAHSTGRTPSEMPSPLLSASSSSSQHDFESCRAYLRCMEECLGVAEGGAAFAARPFHTCRQDELELDEGEAVAVLRRGDYAGSAWWWCRDAATGQEGYVLRDLLASNRPTSCQVQEEENAAISART